MKAKKKLGIVSGMGARAGATFLQKVIDCSPVSSDQDFIEIILHNNPCIPDRTNAILFNGCSPEPELHRSVGFFNRNGVDAIVMACITSYYYHDRLSPATSAYFPDPVSLLSEHLHSHFPNGRIGILASTGALQSGIFDLRFSQYGLSSVSMGEDFQKNLFMESLYMPGGLKSGKVCDTAKNLFFKAVDVLQDQDIDVLVGGCSEVSILLPSERLRTPYIDIMDLLAKDIVSYCYGNM